MSRPCDPFPLLWFDVLPTPPLSALRKELEEDDDVELADDNRVGEKEGEEEEEEEEAKEAEGKDLLVCLSAAS